MNTIRNYLDNMFLRMPQTEEVKRAKKELLAMMEDKYNELKSSGSTENEAIGIVISEFGNLDELGDTLGIKQVVENKKDVPFVSYEEATSYIEESKEVAPKTAFGVLLCILSPITLLLLLGLSEMNFINIREESLVAVGLVVLIGLVAFGVLNLIKFSSRLEKYERLKQDPFEIEYNTEQMVRSILSQVEQSYNKAVSISVISYILSVLPVIITPLITEVEGLSIISVVVTLIIVACATYNIISNNGSYEACKVLLQEGDYSISKKSNKILKAVASAYWCTVVAIYLGYSFITNNWAISWVIWPVAGVLFGAINAIIDGRSQ